MKIAIITDTHYGVRNDNILFLKENKKFFENVFFPYLDKHEIKRVIHLGDVVDRRKFINFNTLNHLRRDFLEPLNDRNIQSHFIVGNHDTSFKNTNSLNAFNELFGRNYTNFITYINEPKEVEFESLKILFIPWICEENRKESYDAINNSTAQIAMGHLEIQGFEMHKGSVANVGDDRNIFSKFDTVYSGHFHHQSTDGHIFYLGTHAEFTWSDYDDPRGFHIFDTETRALEFIPNPSRMFYKIIYNDSDTEFLNTTIEYSMFRDKFVKVVVKDRSNLYFYDLFIEKLEASSPYDYQIIEDNLNLDLDEDSDIINEAESTLDICYNYINKLNLSDKEDRVKKDLTDLYNEAASLR